MAFVLCLDTSVLLLLLLARAAVCVAVCVAGCAAVAQAKQEAGGFWVLRPDSGDPVEVVLMVSLMY
jgi:hypothetical protein